MVGNPRRDLGVASETVGFRRSLARAYGAGVTSWVSCVCTDADSAVIHETGLKPA
jgi:hypothetical protein